MKTILKYSNGGDVPVYDINDFPYDYFIKRKGDFTRKGKRTYWNLFGTFDIETTSVLKSKHPLVKKSFGFMYVWQFCLDSIVVIGRTWDEYIEFINKIQSIMNRDCILVVYVHSLQFEFQFIRNFFNVSELFARKKRNVIRCRCDNIEYRCSYTLTNLSLHDLTQKTPNVVHKKTSGEDFDYNIERTCDTVLSDTEYMYCVHDVLGLWEAINHYLIEDDLFSIPLTSTGYVRRDYRDKCIIDKEHMRRFNKCKLNELQYTLCKEASRGAISGSNATNTNELLEFLQSFDIKSSYPFQMECKYFPASKFTWYSPKYDSELFNFFIENKCCIIEVEFKEVQVRDFVAIPYISKSKCRAIENASCGNGKLYSASRVFCCCTEVDFRIIMTHYSVKEVIIRRMFVADRGKLSSAFREHLSFMFQEKTNLDGVDNLLYNKYKNKINASFGMLLTDILNSEIIYDSLSAECWDTRSVTDVEYALNKYYSNHNSFLNYQDGVWVLAHGRDSLVSGMDIMKQDLVQVDTDSVKGFGDLHNYIPDFDKLNSDIIKLVESSDVPAYATDKNGGRVYLGVWEFEEGTGINGSLYSYRYFKSFGAKKYAYDCGDGKFHTTVSGLKKSSANWIQDKGGFSYFKLGNKVPPGISGRTSSTYNDVMSPYYTSYKGSSFLTGSNIAVENVPYTFGVTAEWFDMILDDKIDIDYDLAEDGTYWG